MINEDVEPPFKKKHKGNPKDQVFSAGAKGKSIADLEEDEVPKSSCGIRKLELPQSVSGDPTSESHHCMSESPSGSKLKDPIQVNSAPGEKNSSTQPVVL